MIFGFDRQIIAGPLKHRTSPRAGGGDHDRRRNLAMIGGNAADASAFRTKRQRLGLRQIRDALIAGPAEKVIGDASAIPVAGVGLVRGQFHFVYTPVRFQLLQLFASDQVHMGPSLALHLNVQLQEFGFVRMNDANKTGSRGSPRAPPRSRANAGRCAG